jgi:hypothetical protein
LALVGQRMAHPAWISWSSVLAWVAVCMWLCGACAPVPQLLRQWDLLKERERQALPHSVRATIGLPPMYVVPDAVAQTSLLLAVGLHDR